MSGDTISYGLVKDFVTNNESQSGTALSGTINTLGLQNTCLSNAYDNEWIVITGGTGINQIRKITLTQGSPNYTVTVSPNWDTIPDTTSQYNIGNVLIWGGSVPTNLNQIWFGKSSLLTQKDFIITGTYADSTSDQLLENDLKMKYGFQWNKPKSYLVQVNYVHTTNDTAGTGTTQSTSGATINVLIQGNSVITNDVIPLVTTGNTEININTSNYDVNRGEFVEIACKSVATMSGAKLDQKDLKVSLVFVSSE
jgi:hypothetical protein